MTCDRFSSTEALRWGFVNRVVADAKVLAESRTLAAKLLSMDALTLSMTKGATNALARLMVPEEAVWSDPELMLLAYRFRRDREKAGVAPKAVRPRATPGGASRSAKSAKSTKKRG